MAQPVRIGFTSSALDRAPGLTFRLGHRLGNSAMRYRQLIASAFGVGNRLGLLSDRLLNCGGKTRLADEPELLNLTRRPKTTNRSAGSSSPKVA